MSRSPLDTWSKREQLCLASAVSCSGDQNWITVSRTLKSVCGNNGNTRPADWYSQKNCAVQYGHLLETVETTKRKKRTNENSGLSSPATVTVETPTELLLRRLTEERLQEIKTQMRRDQELYCKMQREIEALQSDETTEEQLQQMWQEIEKEQETKRIDEMKLENRMREREQRKKDVAGNWRNNNSGSGTGRRSNMTADTTAVDMDVEDISATAPNAANAKQTAAPAPLLTSLLITPGASGTSSNSSNATSSPTSVTPGTPTGTGSVARATAPTITTLLTSGSAAIPNTQPAVIMKNPSDPGFMTRPISGPPVAEVAVTKSSPSQAAPTLSMLLEKNKALTAGKANESTAKSTDTEATSGQKQPSAAEEESADAATPAAATEDAVDEWEVEEQQLLEAFKAVDDIMDEIDIDMEGVIDEDILKDVDNVVSPTEATEAPAKSDVVDFEDKLDALKREETIVDTKSPAQPKPVEVVIGSSDDSNDNIPLAAVASQESKDRSQHSADDETTVAEELNETITIASSSSEENNREPTTVEVTETEAKKDSVPETNEEAEKTIQTQTVEVKAEKTESNTEAPKDDKSKTRAAEATDKTTTEVNADIKTPLPTAASSVHDTDEESSTLTDNSSKPDEPTTTTRSTKSKQQAEHKVEAGINAPAPAAVPVRAPLLRKLPHRDRSESPMVDDDTTTTSDHSTARSSTRRRCSSTPLIDSIPNSPASSEHTDDRRETRGASKKLFLSIYATLLESKHASYFRRAFHDEHSHKSAEMCLRPMDLPTIKRNIESGHLRSINELQRDVLLMCQNLLLIYKPQAAQHKAARLFMQECRGIKEFAANTHTDNTAPSSVTTNKVEKERTQAGNKARSGSRKSQRHH